MEPYPLTLEPHWTLDFVTPLSVEICRHRLQQGSDSLGPAVQRFHWDGGAFWIERCVRLPWAARTRYERVLVIRLRGSLEAVAGGTRVRAGIDPRTQARFRVEKWSTRLVLAGIALAVVLSWLVVPLGPLVILLVDAAFLASAVTFARRWRAIQWLPGDLLGWVQEQVFVLPKN